MTTHDQAMLDGIAYAEQCLASCFLTSTEQKPSMSPQNLPEETAKYLPPHPHNYYLACNGLGQSRGEPHHTGRSRWGLGTGCCSLLMSCIRSTSPFCTLLPDSRLCTSDNFIFHFSWAPPFLLPITYPSTQSNNPKTNNKNKDSGATLVLSFFTVKQTAECKESLWNGSIHLQKCRWRPLVCFPATYIWIITQKLY